MKSIVFLCLVGIIAAAEVDFRQRLSGNSNVNAGRPIRVPVVPSNRGAGVQQKRQVDYDASAARPNKPASARQQTPGGVPLQQAFRPPQSQASFRRPQQEQPQQLAEPIQNSQRPNGPAPSSFAPPSSEQLFTSLRDSGESSARQQRPVRPAPASIERPNRNPEFNAGFPSGFTSGLPSFDFQGRMPEPDAKSDGFMDGVLNNFPNLKSLGGFDAFPDAPREDSNFEGPARKQQGFQQISRPNANRPGAQKTRRRRAANSNNQTVNATRTERRLRNKNRPVLLADDEAMLEPDLPAPSSLRRSSRQPTDIADIIADSAGSEQRFNPSFYPNNGPYGQYAPYSTTNSPAPARSRRPSVTSIGTSSSYKNRPSNRPQYPSQVEFVDDNSLLGSGNFDVLGGGVFRDSNDYRPYNNYKPQYYPPSPPVPETYQPHQPYYSLGQPPSQQLGHFAPQQSPIQHQHDYNTPNYPTSFFDDDFFSNFRDFADVNQDYRN